MKKKHCIILVAVFVAIIGVAWFFALAFPPDPMIETYAAKMNEVYWLDPVHVQETITTTKGAEEPYTRYQETWMSKDYYARIKTYSDGEKMTQTHWDREGYLNRTLKNGSADAYYTVTSIESSYYCIPYREKVSYEETENQLIFTYENKDIPERYAKKAPGSTVKRVYSQAESVAVFTKDWMLESLTVTERWEERQDDGTAVSMEKIHQAVYLPCTQESFMEDVERVVWGYRPDFPHIEEASWADKSYG